MVTVLKTHLEEEESGKPCCRPPAGKRQQISSGILFTVAIIVLILQPACALRKVFQAPARLFQKRVPSQTQYPTSPIRIAYLPANLPPDNAELRLVALAAPIMMAKISEEAQDLEVTPLWEVMPAAIESAGTSRSITPDDAAYIAERLGARWATYAEISPVPRGIEMVLDYIPAKSEGVPYRYTRIGNADEIGYGCYDALEQFLRYLVAHPIDLETIRETRFSSLLPLAEAVDREYGWFVAADPGKAEEVVAGLARYDRRLARLVFNPNLYPILADPPAGAKPADSPPAPGEPLTNALPSSGPRPAAP